MEEILNMLERDYKFKIYKKLPPIKIKNLKKLLKNNIPGRYTYCLDETLMTVKSNYGVGMGSMIKYETDKKSYFFYKNYYELLSERFPVGSDNDNLKEIFEETENLRTSLGEKIKETMFSSWDDHKFGLFKLSFYTEMYSTFYHFLDNENYNYELSLYDNLQKIRVIKWVDRLWTIVRASVKLIIYYKRFIEKYYSLDGV